MTGRAQKGGWTDQLTLGRALVAITGMQSRVEAITAWRERVSALLWAVRTLLPVGLEKLCLPVR